MLEYNLGMESTQKDRDFMYSNLNVESPSHEAPILDDLPWHSDLIDWVY